MMRALMKKINLYSLALNIREHFRKVTMYRVNQSIRVSLIKKYRQNSTVLPNYFSGEQLESMKHELRQYIGTPFESYSEAAKKRTFRQVDMFAKNSLLKLFSNDSILHDIASYYWGQPIKLISSFGYRIEPQAPAEYSSYQWHHDCKRKQLKVFVLLTDLDEKGQVFQFAPGTHKHVHVFKSYDDSRFTQKDIELMCTPITISGKAGTVFFVDTNGLHKGVRNLSKNRDLWCNLLVPQHFSEAYNKTNTLMSNGLIDIPLT